MKNFIFFLIILGSIFSCSKEQDIAFIPSLSDTIEPNFYYDLTGTYSGKISRIRFNPTQNPGEISFSILFPSLDHEIVVTDIDFSTIALDDISKVEDRGAAAAVQRLEQTDGAFVKFLPVSMDTSLQPVYVNYVDYGSYIDSFNGEWSRSDGNLYYFIRLDTGGSPTDYFFEGKRL